MEALAAGWRGGRQGLLPQKKLTDFSERNLELFVIECCRGELTHLLAILAFWLFGFTGLPAMMI